MEQELTVKVKCIGCSNTKFIKEGEVEQGDHPMCDLCGSPFIAEEASI